MRRFGQGFNLEKELSRCRLNGGSRPWLSGPWRRKEKDSPPSLGLGTIYIASLRERTDLTTRVWVQSLCMGIGRC